MYLAGGMTGLSPEDCSLWRNKFALDIRRRELNWHVFNPVNHFNDFNNTDFLSDREPMDFDLSMLRKSDLVVANLTAKSIGTSCELGIAYDRRIPILGYTEGNIGDLHPWLRDMCLRVFDSYEDLFEYFTFHF